MIILRKFNFKPSFGQIDMFYEETLKDFKSVILKLNSMTQNCMVDYANYRFLITTQCLQDCHGVQVASCCTVDESP